MTAWQNWKALSASADIRSRRGWFRIWLLAATGWAIFAALHVDWPWQIKPETVASQTVRHGQKPADVLAQVQSEAALVCQPGSATINRSLEPEQPGSSNDPVVDQIGRSLREEQVKRAGLSKASDPVFEKLDQAFDEDLKRRTGLSKVSAPSIDDILNAAGEEQAKRAGLSKVSDPVIDAANQYWDDDIKKRAGLAVPAVRAQQSDQASQNVKAMAGPPDYTKQWFTQHDNAAAARPVAPQVMVETISASCFLFDRKEGVMAWALVVVLGLPVAVPLVVLLIGYVLLTVGKWIWLGFRVQPESADLSIALQADSAALEPATFVDDGGLLRLKKALRWSTVSAMAGDIMLRNALTSAHASGTNILFFAVISSATFYGCKSYGKRHHANLLVLGMAIFWVLAVAVMLLAAAPFM